IRLPAVISGIVLIPLTYMVMQRIIGTLPAVCASALVAISPAMIDFSVNGRGYIIAADIFLVQLGSALSLQTELKLPRLVLFAALGAVGMWTVPSYLFALCTVWFFLTLGIYTGTGPKQSKTILKLIGCAILTILITLGLYCPVLVSSGI